MVLSILCEMYLNGPTMCLASYYGSWRSNGISVFCSSPQFTLAILNEIMAFQLMNCSSLGQLSGCEYCNSGIPIRPFTSLVGALSTAGGRNVCVISMYGWSDIYIFQCRMCAYQAVTLARIYGDLFIFTFCVDDVKYQQKCWNADRHLCPSIHKIVHYQCVTDVQSQLYMYSYSEIASQ